MLFLMRLWPENNEYEAVNAQRINIIRSMKKEYGKLFYGGVRQSDTAKKLCPDLIVSKRLTERAHYIKILSDADVCIGTLGLHGSTGWKTAEYVAAGKAIVNEHLIYEVPGGFKAGENYLGFSSVDDACEAVEALICDPMRLLEMKKANQRYYENYLKPECLILNTIKNLT